MQVLPHWYIAKIAYFQALGFFQNMGTDTHTIAHSIFDASTEHYYGPILDLVHHEFLDQILLSYDTQRTWFIEDFMVLGHEPAFRNHFYPAVFHRLSQLTNGIFQPKNLTIEQCGYCQGRDKRLQISFEWESQVHQLIFCIDSEMLILNFLDAINELLVAKGDCFRVWQESYGNCLVLFIPLETAQTLEIQQGWEFSSLAYYWFDMAQYLHKQQQSENAFEYYRKAFEKITHDPHIGSEFTLFLSDYHRYPEAQVVYEQTIERLQTKPNLNTTEQWWVKHLSDLLKKLGD